MTPRVVRNDWSSVQVPPLAGWRPQHTVSVIIPAYQCQHSLDLTLAGLATQTYPAHLLEVLVVDDGSQPPLELPKLRPAHCQLLRVTRGWGRANALHLGAEHAQGQILHWLDADMVVYPQHVEAQARWHHQLPYAVTLGGKRFVDAPWPTPQEVIEAAADGRSDDLFGGHRGEPHTYVERRIARTNQLRAGDHETFLAHVGATAALHRKLYEAAGGLDVSLRLGEDTELGYRLAQAGAVFIPEPAARSWHLGPTHMMRHQAALQRYNRPFLAERMPLPRWLRVTGGAGRVPLVTAVVQAAGAPLERVRAAVDSVLASDQRDVQVLLIGPWDSLPNARVPPLSDPIGDLRLLAATYRADPRVRLLATTPESVFPSPYLLELASGCALAPSALHRLQEYADTHRLGLVQAGAGARWWRTAALARAHWVRHAGEEVAAAVAAVHGAGAVAPAQVGVADLSGFTVAQLADGTPAAALRSGRWLPSSVQVAGFRSLMRAGWVVLRLAIRRGRTWVHARFSR